MLLSLTCSVAAQQHGRFVYTWDQLIALKPVGMATRTANIPEELWRRTHRGCRGGTNQRTGKARERRRRFMEKREYKPRLPSLIMGNMRSLANKMDELTVLARSQREYRECSLMCFSETSTRTFRNTTFPSMASRLFGPTRAAPRAVPATWILWSSVNEVTRLIRRSTGSLELRISTKPDADVDVRQNHCFKHSLSI